MASEIPRWLGPVLTPIVLILLVAVICWYYCYWKPRKEREKDKNNSKNEQRKSHNIVGQRGPVVYKTKELSMKNTHHTSYVEEGQCYDVYNGNSLSPVTMYGPYCLEYCPLPTNINLNYCMQYSEYEPKVFHYARPPHAIQSRGIQLTQCRNKSRKCKVKCKREACMKCPDLPSIVEGNSSLSICEEQEEEEPKICTAPKAIDEDGDGDDGALTEIKIEKENIKSRSCCDSGYEEQ